MSGWRKFEFFLFRYVPDAIREEFVNFGLILTEKNPEDVGFAGTRFANDWRRILCLDPQADVEALERLQEDIQGQFSVLKDRLVLLRWLEESASNLVEVSSPKVCFSIDPVREIDLLELQYLKVQDFASAPKRKAVGRRQYIYGRMRDAFENAGIWEFLVKGIPVAQYTRGGDPFEFDMGYPLKNELRLFHAVSLKTNVDAGVMLAARYPAIAAGMNASRGVVPVLTAVVDDGLDKERDEIGFALAMMKENNIEISPVAEMPMIAERARQESGA